MNTAESWRACARASGGFFYSLVGQSPTITVKDAMTETRSFLGSTDSIRTTIVRSLSGASAVDLAVAFVTSEWHSLLGEFTGKCRLICWLNTTATDPDAVDLMMRRPNVEVRHINGMHAKTYLFKGPRRSALVGSANLSGAGLACDSTAGRIEAAVEVFDRIVVGQVENWFSQLWRKARHVTPADLAAARKAYAARQRPSLPPRTPRGPARAAWWRLDPKWKPSPLVRSLANDVGKMSPRELRRELGGLRDIHPEAMTKQDLLLVVDHLTHWARRRGAFAPVLTASLRDVRAAFRIAFDNSLGLEARLDQLTGVHKLPGLGLPAWSMILYWRFPELYPPFNARTKSFLSEVHLKPAPPKTLTPEVYAKWCVLAGELQTRLHLPTPGHVDRLILEYSRT